MTLDYRRLIDMDSYYEVPDMLQVDADQLGGDYQAIYMDPPLLLPGEMPAPGKLTVDQFVSGLDRERSI